MKLKMETHDYPGILVTFCGLDGCGKTTQISLLNDFLSQHNFKTYLTKQPTKEMRQSIIFRNYIDTPNYNEYDYRALNLICAADRIQHIQKVIIPHLKLGENVISDRYIYSCLANLYSKGYENDNWIYEISRYIIKPDVAFFIDVDVEVALARIREREKEKNRYIDVDLQFKLRDAYLKIANDNHGIVLNANYSIEEMSSIVRYHVLDAYNKKKLIKRRE